MRNTGLRAGFVGCALGLGLLRAGISAAAPPDKPGYVLTFDDEFDGSSLDTSKWQRRYKWGEAVINGELEAYIDDAFVDDGSILSIVGKHEQGQYAGQTLDYTSGVICSVHEQTYGYFESRLKVPKGQGLWPAFWLLGANGTTGVNEIDIHEILGNDPTTAYMTVHWGQSYSVGHQSDGSSYTGPDFSADYHTFGLEWDPDEIVWTIDGVERKTHTGDGVPQVDMYVILNLAIGGSWPGAPDSTTPFPADYDIDYVRAYQRVGDAGADASNSSGTQPDASALGSAPDGSSESGARGGSGTGGSPAKSAGGTVTGAASGGAPSGAMGGVPAGSGGTTNDGTNASGGSAPTDGGKSTSTANSGGCGCRVERSRSDSFALGAAALAGLISMTRRRGRGRGRKSGH